MDDQEYDLTVPVNREDLQNAREQNGSNQEKVLRRIIPAMKAADLVKQPLRPLD